VYGLYKISLDSFSDFLMMYIIVILDTIYNFPWCC